MGIFSNIIAKIFPASHPAVAAAAAQEAAPAPAPHAAAAAPADAAPAPAPAPMPPVDVEAVVSAMPGADSLNWRTSIVDLMKVLGLDSSLDARKQLAGELGYTGSTSDSATMNVWLHKEVMDRVAANGGTVPDSMKG